MLDDLRCPNLQLQQISRPAQIDPYDYIIDISGHGVERSNRIGHTTTLYSKNCSSANLLNMLDLSIKLAYRLILKLHYRDSKI